MAVLEGSVVFVISPTLVFSLPVIYFSAVTSSELYNKQGL